MIKEKKGMLLASETLKIVLSVISIGLLLFLLYSLYYSSISNQEEKAAEATMERVREIISEVEANSSFVGSVDGLTPSGWTFFSFVGSEKKPNQCVGASCICLCGEKSFGEMFERQLQECSSDGKCEVVNDLVEFEKIKIEKGGETSILIMETNFGIEVEKNES